MQYAWQTCLAALPFIASTMSPQKCLQVSTSLKKKSITIGTKLQILTQIEAMQQCGSSLGNVAREFNIQGNQIRRWRKQFETAGSAGILQRNNKNARLFCTGRALLLEPFEYEILQWLFSLQEQGMPVSIGMVVLKATRKLVGWSFQKQVGEGSVTWFVTGFGLP
jgi:hypothetical protein